MAETKTPLIDLRTLIERPSIAIDGEDYEILSTDELSALDHQWLHSSGQRLDLLMNKESLSAKEKKELEDLLMKVSDRIMVGVPDEVRARLTGRHRIGICEVFTMLLLQSRTAAAGALAKALGLPTGETPSPGSSASMAATPPAGSATSPSPSSGATSR